jgi:hypothetical protein
MAAMLSVGLARISMVSRQTVKWRDFSGLRQRRSGECAIFRDHSGALGANGGAQGPKLLNPKK